MGGMVDEVGPTLQSGGPGVLGSLAGKVAGQEGEPPERAALRAGLGFRKMGFIPPGARKERAICNPRLASLRPPGSCFSSSIPEPLTWGPRPLPAVKPLAGRVSDALHSSGGEQTGIEIGY